jgi:hypothetical protein
VYPSALPQQKIERKAHQSERKPRDGEIARHESGGNHQPAACALHVPRKAQSAAQEAAPA